MHQEISPIKNILKDLTSNRISLEEAESLLNNNLTESLSYATIDHNRMFFKNFPEVIYAAGKSSDQVIELSKKIFEISSKVLITKSNREVNHTLAQEFPDIQINDVANMAFRSKSYEEPKNHGLLVLCAGTTDIPVAEEAAFTAECMGIKAERVFDVGIAGLSRIINNLEKIRNAKIIITVAGMEGALPSVVSGLTASPVIAVPTSVGYGSNMEGLSALLSMLNSCSPGIGVVNIDNGFGAGFLANAMINSLNHPQ